MSGGVKLRESIAEDEVGAPLLSQAAAVKVEEGDVVESKSVSQSNEASGGKSTPSTLSDNAGEEGVGDQEAGKHLGQSSVASKKRIGSKGRDLEELEASEEGQDLKRKPRKSARLA